MLLLLLGAGKGLLNFHRLYRGAGFLSNCRRRT